MPGEPEGIGEDGLDAVRNFVAAGGGYVGIGSGGGLLATDDFAGLINLELAHDSLGTARVNLRVDNPAHPLMAGLTGYIAENGEKVEDQFPALYYTESLIGVVGGPIFTAGSDVEALAYYDSVDYDPADHYVVNTELFSPDSRGVAVAFRQVNDGMALLSVFVPAFAPSGRTHSNFYLTLCSIIGPMIQRSMFCPDGFRVRITLFAIDR
jgi:hypothetical protein